MTTISGVRALRKIQIGPEAVADRDTGVTPGVFLIGTLGMKMEQELYMPDDLETGRLVSYERSEVIAQETSLPFESDANYLQLGHLLQMGFGMPTAANVYEPMAGSATLEEPTSYTFRYGDDKNVWESHYVLARMIEFSGQVGEVVRVKADLFGRAMESIGPNGFVSTVIPPRDLESVKMATCKLYASATWGTVGNTGTEVPATLIDFNYRAMTGFEPVKFADGRYDFSEVAQKKRHVELDMTVGFNDTSVGWFTSFAPDVDVNPRQTRQVLGIHFEGVGNRALNLQMSGVITEYNELTEREGQDIVKVKWISLYDDAVAANRDMRISLVSIV